MDPWSFLSETHTLNSTHLPLVPPHIWSVNWMGIGSGNGLSPVRCQAITWTNADVLSIGSLGANFSEISIEIQTFSFKKMCLKTFCSGGDSMDSLSGLKKKVKAVVALRSLQITWGYFCYYHYYCCPSCCCCCCRYYYRRTCENLMDMIITWHPFHKGFNGYWCKFCENEALSWKMDQWSAWISSFCETRWLRLGFDTLKGFLCVRNVL